MSQSSGKPAAAHAPGGVPDRALEFALAGLLVMLPFSHTTAMLRLLLGVGLLAALTLAWRERWRLGAPFPPFAVALAAWVAWCLASLGWSVDPELTLSELRAELFYACALLFTIHVGVRREGVERLLFPAAAVAGIALGLGALAWAVTGATSRFDAGAGYISSTVLVLFPVACVAAASGGIAPGARPLALALAIALLVAGLTTLNRTLGPALAVELVLVAVLLGGRRLLVPRLALVVAAALAFAALQAGVAQGVRFTGIEAPAQAERDDPRPALWSHVVDRIAEAPLLGRGYGRDILAKDLRDTFGNPLVNHAHNVFLDAGVQLGIPGVALLLVLFGSIAFAGVRYARSDDALARACGAALVAVVAGTVARNLSDDLWVRQNALLFWAVVGVLSALAERRLRLARGAR